MERRGSVIANWSDIDIRWKEFSDFPVAKSLKMQFFTVKSSNGPIPSDSHQFKQRNEVKFL